MAEIRLQSARVGALVGKLKAAGVPEHVRAGLEAKLLKKARGKAVVASRTRPLQTGELRLQLVPNRTALAASSFSEFHSLGRDLLAMAKSSNEACTALTVVLACKKLQTSAGGWG
jgi:hypothetical protein